jgi:hypothetical protein
VTNDKRAISDAKVSEIKSIIDRLNEDDEDYVYEDEDAEVIFDGDFGPGEGDRTDLLTDPGGISFPWPVSVSTVTRKGADGTLLYDATLSFDPIPEAASYEVRVTPLDF